MKKCLILLLFIFLLVGCNKQSKNVNDLPQNSPAPSEENNIPQISPTQSAEDNKPESSPTQSAEDVNTVISPTQSAEDNASQITPVPTDQVEISPTVNEDITTPILVKGLFMGGLSEGKWMQQDEFFHRGSVDLKGFQYDIYYDGINMGTGIGGLPTSWMTGEPIQGDQYEQEFCIVELLDKDNQEMDYDIAIKAEWNLFPRPYIVQNTEQTYYINLVKDYLTKYGLENPDTSIKQILRVDLEGDGTDEILIAADNTIEDQFEEVKKGDNAVLLFRKVVDGEVINQTVEKDIRLKEEEYPSIFRYLSRVETITDLDGDNIMEVIVKSWYYEGASWSIYKLIDNRLELVASSGYGA